MNILVDRKYKKAEYTISNLYINGKYFCNTIEDTDRGLTQNMPLAEIKAKKVASKTAIPTGTYKVTLDVVSPKFGSKPFYKEVCNGKLPRLLDVKGFEGILIHVGEGPKGYELTSGCLLVGLNTIKGGLTQSKEYFKALYTKLKEAHNKGEDIIITIK